MEQKNTKQFIQQTLFLVVGALWLVISSYILWFLFYHDLKISSHISAWGAFGDYFGGIMNPVVACAALFLLAKSLTIQHKELSATRDALLKASDSQAEQAKISAQQTDISLYSMMFQKITTALEAEMAYRNTLISNGLNNGRCTTSLNKEGAVMASDKLIIEASAKIQKLEEHQENIISIISKLREEADLNGPLIPTLKFDFSKAPEK